MSLVRFAYTSGKGSSHTCNVVHLAMLMFSVLLVLSASKPANAQIPDAIRAVAQAEADTNAGIQRVGLVRLDFSGDVPEVSRDLFVSRLVEGLAVARFQVLSGGAVRQKLSTPALRECTDTDCYPAVAEALEVGYLVSGRIEESNKSYDIVLTIINGRTGAVIGQASERCETCGITEAAEKVSLATASLRNRLEAVAMTPAHVVIRSSPSGALAAVDGKPVGKTPLDLQLPGGQHALALTRDGYEQHDRTFTVVSGVDETLNVDLLRIPSTLPLKALGWSGLLAGTALVAAGVYLARIDGKTIACSDDNKDVNGRCPRIRDTDATAVALTGVGAVVLTLGGVTLWVVSEQAPAAKEQAMGVSWSGRF
ncbi:MAG: PEGA domain-containing protein [Deltaproteobacteria bacterium]|nr:PEGA domain-containing protein [Deltaproteobacteria bacterium]